MSCANAVCWPTARRELLIAPGAHTVLHQWGTPGQGYHQPPTNYGAPNGVFPTPDGHFLVTEIRGDWVDSIDLHGHVYFTAHPAGIAYPSDSNQIGPDKYVTVDYSQPGQILIFDHTGNALWRYRPTGADALDHPSLALPLPNGDIVCNDDFNHRVIVVDPHTNTIVWQYGHTGVAGSAPGYLNNPDGLDLVPPNSLADNTTGQRGPPATDVSDSPVPVRFNAIAVAAEGGDHRSIPRSLARTPVRGHGQAKAQRSYRDVEGLS